MKFKDLVVNSLPRVRGRKSKKTAHAHPPSNSSTLVTPAEPDILTAPRYSASHQPVFDSRESSVERSSTVAVVEAPWHENAVCRSRHTRTRGNEVSQMSQPSNYYTPPPPQHRMVMSHSADAISSHATMAVLMTSSDGHNTISGSKVTSITDPYGNGDYQQYMSAISENAVNYIGPNCFYYQHHHHHNHNHNHHYVYHHHHNRSQQPQIPPNYQRTAPLMEKSHHQVSNAMNTQSSNNVTSEKPRKSESGGFFRKSFASFRAMRKQGIRNKDQDSRHKSPPPDENEKCMVCPYPQTQNGEKNTNSSDRKSQQTRKGFKGFTKSKKKKDSSKTERRGENPWYSDTETNKICQSQFFNNDALPYIHFQQFPVRECSMESSISHHNEAESREGSCVREFEKQYHETASLSGYDSDAAKNRSGRSRSRIKTNPWLPSPQPSLSMRRRPGNGRVRESSEDVMEEESGFSCFPRSASFDYHTQVGVSTFQSPSCQKEQRRPVQRHRSLTPVDLKMHLSLPRTKKCETGTPQIKEENNTTAKGSDARDETHLNDLNSNRTKSRPNSIISPNSEFIVLADNIEQLANNISFEYEDMADTTLDNNTTPTRVVSTGSNGTRDEDRGSSKLRKSGSSPFPSEQLSNNANSPDSGIGCMGSCNGDDGLVNTSILGASPTFVTPTISPISLHNETGDTSIGFSQSPNSPLTDETKSDTICMKSADGQISTRIFLSSSNESLNSAVISESDIDNTSYKYTENLTQVSFVADSSKPLNFQGSLMVDERLDVDFRSLPRRNTGNNMKKRMGISTVRRSQTMKNPEIVFMDKEHEFNPSQRYDTYFRKREIECRRLKPQYPRSSDKVKSDETMSLDNQTCYTAECDWTSSLINASEGHKTPFMSNGDSASYLGNDMLPLVVNLDSKQSYIDKHQVDVVMKREEDEATSSTDTRQESNAPMQGAVSHMDTTFSSQITGDSHSDADASFDTVDACVQTDFNDDFDSWEKRQNSPAPLLDDSFDPAESTRRWLLCGNMQGSADTGYFSQPRDSHVFMEEEAAMLQLDTMSDKAINSITHQTNVKSVGEDSVCKDGSNTEQTISTHVPKSDDSDLQSKEHIPANLILDKLLSGIESQFRGVFDQMATSKEGDISVQNKRYSSDSSTSTLTSEINGLETVKESNTRRTETHKSHCQSNNGGPVVARKDMAPPDYVNLPVRNISLANKVDSLALKTRDDLKHAKRHKSSKECSRCHSMDFYNQYSKAEKQNTFNQETPDVHFCNEDRADYLEFLKDTPVKKGQYAHHVFIVPGFGPIELSLGLSEPNGKTPREKISGSSHVTNELATQSLYADRSHCSSSKSVGNFSRINTKNITDDKTAFSMTSLNGSTSNGSSELTRGAKGACCQPSSKRRGYHVKETKVDRCPTMRSYEVDPSSLPVIPSQHPPLHCGQTSKHTSYQHSDRAGKTLEKDNTTRSLVERVALLRRDKEIIYRKIQEVQEQEMSRQKEQLQHQRHLHCQRKDELLETLNDLKEKLEEQSKKLQFKCWEEV